MAVSLSALRAGRPLPPRTILVHRMTDKIIVFLYSNYLCFQTADEKTKYFGLNGSKLYPVPQPTKVSNLTLL
jgi:hypothetical protein